MFLSYWGLKEKPFENTPDPRFMYYSLKHKEALLNLLYAVNENKGAALLTGDVGCGKTLIARLWFDFESVDHMADLARGSNFVACADGFCPDFALGEPRTDNVSACETLFKIQTVVNQP